MEGREMATRGSDPSAVGGGRATTAHKQLRLPIDLWESLVEECTCLLRDDGVALEALRLLQKIPLDPSSFGSDAALGHYVKFRSMMAEARHSGLVKAAAAGGLKRRQSPQQHDKGRSLIFRKRQMFGEKPKSDSFPLPTLNLIVDPSVGSPRESAQEGVVRSGFHQANKGSLVLVKPLFPRSAPTTAHQQTKSTSMREKGVGIEVQAEAGRDRASTAGLRRPLFGDKFPSPDRTDTFPFVAEIIELSPNVPGRGMTCPLSLRLCPKTFEYPSDAFDTVKEWELSFLGSTVMYQQGLTH
uniref:Uncharacterized protein n=1 Tax=Chromera velia CCMP2878 TaxID=1169474 RepID=A0A0G4HQ13_9ALVE|eukprot:Cvel_7854.t1-p1 / transcript=Cvel_7854.t1 / gene=Cvel_7854 / organism=Chromera_velia_CCMP2878 / gene_product=hypothetical protein / transcript_product=hypothetical protein / location=Cvel_scaffold420:66225-67115(+) / protein_length=297 / sequence_SO=supercontig / SO=protein_coding / is_pseudo=false